MPTTLDPSRFMLPRIDGWPAADSRRLAFTVTDENGNAKDLTNDTVSWFLTEKPYQERDSAVLADDDAAVTLQTDTVVDPTAGEFRVDIAEGALLGEWGGYHHHVAVDPLDDSRQSWRGVIVLEDAGGAGT